ncbi:DUF748 domain-containing protein [Trinickia violacea]|uniref:DUF748 domain-containing protein n=1 Tax=Trinickia violacea TaxID=2571746 RepID=A0A4P8IZ41_9BURK|nr:DUF748 domain-containing protein [Trinickia violacea]QCP54632.1 DUF748 domain-containing protein [Trinickia violacea]
MASPSKAALVSSLQTLRSAAQSNRAKRIAIGLLIFIVLFGLLGFFAAPPLIRHIAEQQLSKQLDRPASIGRIALNPYTLNLEADRIHVGERSGVGDFVDISRLVVQASWSSLFRLAPIVNEIKIDSPRIHLVRYDAQRFNFTDLIEKFSTPSKPESKPTPFSISNIQIENGSFYFDDQLLGQKHVVDQFALGVPFIATLASKTNVFVDPRLRARIDGSPLAIDGKTKPFAASRESEVALKFDGIDVPKMLSYVPAKLPVTVTSGKLASDLKLNFMMEGETPTLSVTGTTDLTELAVVDAAKAPLFAASGVHVAAAELQPLKSVFHFDDIHIDQPVVNLAREKDGTLSIMRALTPPAASGAAAASAPEASSATAESTPESKPAAPLDLSIKRFAINDGTIHVDDRVPAQPVSVGLTHLAVGLDDFSTLAKTPARYTFNTDLQNGGSVGLAGSFGLVAKNADAKVTLASIPLPIAQPYIEGVSSARVTDGTLSTTVNATADWSKSPVAVQVGDSEVNLKSLKIAGNDAKTPAVALADGHVAIKQIDLTARTADITSIDATGLAINAQRMKDGRIDLQTLAAPRQAGPERKVAHGAQQAQAQGPAWRYKIGSFTLKDASADFVDNSTPQPAKLSFTPIQLSVQNISDDLSKPLPVTLQATLNQKGSVDVKGDVTASPLKLALNVNGNRLDAAAFEPYFGSKLNATMASALLNLKGDLAFAQTEKAMSASYSGDAALVDVRLLDRVNSTPLAGWGALSLANLKARYDEHGTDVDVGRVTLANFFGRVLLDAQGKLNLNDVLAQQKSAAQGKGEPVPLTPGSAPVPASAPAAAVAQQASAAAAASASAHAAAPAAASAATASAAPSAPVNLHFGQLVLQKGRVNYTDDFIKPNYTANLVDITGTIGAFGTQSTTPAPVDVGAKLEANGPISIRGTVNPLAKKPQLDLTATAHGIELTNLTPYSAKYAGYPITKGKLNVDLSYKLDNDQLTANNHIFIDQLTFGDHIQNDTATKLPVRLAISLLKNSRGEIDVNIPVSGSLANPEFSIGGVIWHAFVNLIEKAVTAPFSLLANAFGGGGEDLGYVEFDPGSAKLTDATTQKLDTIVKALNDKPSVKIDLIGRVDPAIDTPGLRLAYVDRLVRQEKVKDVVGHGESVDPSTVKVDPKEYDDYLTKAYKDADFKKPRNFIGLTKSIPADDMKTALAEHAPIDDASLRALAQRRAQAVQQYFESKVDSSRVFIVAPKLDAQGIKDKGATTRVDFGLK